MSSRPALSGAARRRMETGPQPADEVQRTGANATGAMTLIKTLRLPATPRMYELCYAYATGEYPTVNLAINELLGQRVAVGDKAMLDIAARYVSPGHVQDEVNSVGTRVAKEIERVLGSIDTMSSTIDECSGDIAEAAKVDDEPDRRSAMLTGVQKLLVSSNKMDDEKRKLEAALTASNSEIANLRTQLQNIRTTAGNDPLTGLPNRQQLKPLIAKALAESLQSGESLCVAAGDLDDFAAFNAAWGFDRGDQVLRLVAADMKQKVGVRGSVVRSSGAEFTLILRGASLSQAAHMATHICNSVMQREVKIRSTGQTLGKVGISFGIALARKGDSAETLAGRAQACLRDAKLTGRNRVICEDDPALQHSAEAVA